MMRFLQTHLRHINDDNDKTLRLRIRFVVAEDGSIAGFKVIQSGGENIDLKVIKALQKMPGWNPARKNGRNVAMYCSAGNILKRQNKGFINFNRGSCGI